jgi:pimeloyl-ACP methyl ester carboxylesterase
MYVATHPHNNSLVVLIHGVMSNRYRAWKEVIDLIQKIHREGSAALKSYDYFAFEYPSGYLLQPPLEECFSGLRTLISNPRYDTVVLIGHSQGGVLAKLFVVDEFLANRGRDMKVDIVITLDSPHRGPQPWIYPLVILGGLWKLLPYLKRMPFLRQVADLSFGSANLKKLRRHWTSDFVSPEPCAAELRKRHIRSYTLSGTRWPFPPIKLVVSNRSAYGLKLDEPIKDEAIASTAWGLGHGLVAMAAYRHQIEQRLSDHDAKPIADIAGTARALVEHGCREALTPHCAAADVRCEVETWTRRFTDSFRRRPLRALPFPTALERFISLRREHP